MTWDNEEMKNGDFSDSGETLSLGGEPVEFVKAEPE